MNDNTILKQIGARIRNERVTQKLSQEDLADKANTSVSLISDIELGKSNMRIDTFIRIIESLNVSADSILRANVPNSQNIYQNEFSELLKDCSSNELETILTLVKNVKATLKSH